ncbi:MAG: P1 family peptidase [Runella sp.]
MLKTEAQTKRIRDYGLSVGIFQTGKLNAITDVVGVKVGHTTLVIGDSIRTGATAILPHGDNIFQQKVAAAIELGNGFGKLAGYSQVAELGQLETPILLTNTLNVATGIAALVEWTLSQKGNENVRSVNAVVGETNDSYLNDIRGRHLTTQHALAALQNAQTGKVTEGNVGAGTGTVCFGWKGGIGTASRKLPPKMGGYTVGVLVQTNFGGVLEIAGVPVGVELGKYAFKETLDKSADGSCMMVVATDAPLDARNLQRLAKRALLGMGKTGGSMANGSGDYVIAFSTAYTLPHESNSTFEDLKLLRNDETSPLFLAAIEATEEAILNSLFAAQTMQGHKGHKVEALPIPKVIEILKKYQKIK